MADASVTDKVFEKLKDRTVSLTPLLKILECAVCLEVVKIPFKQCQRGHLICDDCLKQPPLCPTCKASFTMESSVCMKNLIESLPRPCRYIGAGCEVVVEPNSDHESYCEYRPVGCRLCTGDRIPLYQLEDHMLENHSPLNMFNKENGKITGMKFLSDSCYGFLISVMNHIFWLSLKYSQNDGSLELKWYAHFIGKPTGNNYYIKLTFKHGYIGSTHTLKALDLSTASRDESDCSTKVFLTSLARCIDAEGMLAFPYKVFSKPNTTE